MSGTTKTSYPGVGRLSTKASACPSCETEAGTWTLALVVNRSAAPLPSEGFQNRFGTPAPPDSPRACHPASIARWRHRQPLVEGHGGGGAAPLPRPAGVDEAAQSDPTGPVPNLLVQAEASQIVSSPGSPSRRLRPLGAVAQMLLEAGPARSPTLARLLETVGRSDLIVYVATGSLRVPGRLDFACSKPGVRFLRITINVPEAGPHLIAALAHELQHAAEIAGAPEVIDAATLARHYREQGQCIAGDEYCTKAAQRVTGTVLCELAAGASARR